MAAQRPHNGPTRPTGATRGRAGALPAAGGRREGAGMSKREGLRVDRGALGGYAILYTATAAGPNSFKKKKKKKKDIA